MGANGSGASADGYVEPEFEVDIWIVEGGDAANVVSFLHDKGAHVVLFAQSIIASRVPLSALGELSELPDVECVEELVGPNTPA